MCILPSSNLILQESMIALFERAVTDVPVSALLWKAYTQYLSECGKPVEDQRSVFERALAHSGLHPRNAGVLFAAFRELEQASLDEAEEEAYSADEESIRLARSRLDKVYSRQLSVPLVRSSHCYDRLIHFMHFLISQCAGYESDCSVHRYYLGFMFFLLIVEKRFCSTGMTMCTKSTRNGVRSRSLAVFRITF